MTEETIANAYQWIKDNFSQLEKAYCELPHQMVRELPFALYCLAMYLKHQGISN
jgi:hypothetical protein